MSSAAVVIGALRVKTKEWHFYFDLMQLKFERKNPPIRWK